MYLLSQGLCVNFELHFNPLSLHRTRGTAMFQLFTVISVDMPYRAIHPNEMVLKGNSGD
jgi:hypothetical protein